MHDIVATEFLREVITPSFSNTDADSRLAESVESLNTTETIQCHTGNVKHNQ